MQTEKLENSNVQDACVNVCVNIFSWIVRFLFYSEIVTKFKVYHWKNIIEYLMLHAGQFLKKHFYIVVRVKCRPWFNEVFRKLLPNERKKCITEKT